MKIEISSTSMIDLDKQSNSSVPDKDSTKAPSDMFKKHFQEAYKNHHSLDTNKDGKLDAKELSDALEQKITLNDLVAMLSAAQGKQGGKGEVANMFSEALQAPSAGGAGGKGGDGLSAHANNAHAPQPTENANVTAPIDENGDGNIDAAEFMKAFDKNSDGKLSTKEMESALQGMGLGDSIPAK
jgi:Ca2+-binding EF-hand superfamily protein